MTLEALATSGGTGLLLGGVAGFAAKKIIKIAAVIVGAFILGLAYLQYQKIIMVNWTNATNTAGNATHIVYHQLSAAAAVAGVHINSVVGVAGGGFMAGFALGFMRG